MQNLIEQRQAKLAVIGMGYVGLPLAVEFGKHFHTFGFDINQQRIDELKQGHDRTQEVTSEQLKESEQLTFAADIEALKTADIYIVTVPTPINEAKQPDLTPLIKASESIGSVLNQDNIVIYESTVFPGCTEEVCVPILEQKSALSFNKDFFAGYSPERINPGDKKHTVTQITKVTSGSTPEIGDVVNALYQSIIVAGTHLASSIKVAEAAKVIENCQRDLNIAFVNELSVIFNQLNIDTLEVLEAAGTKWNFLPFRPGLVGGHCIGVDPYYLTHKAQSIGYKPEVILAGRQLNDNMGKEVASRVIKKMIRRGAVVQNAKALVLGITFKENCPDIRNSRVIDVVRELEEFGCQIDVYDPWADVEEVKQEYGIDLIDSQALQNNRYEAVIVAVAHKEFSDVDFKKLKHDTTVLFDIKGILPQNLIEGRL